jgi:hypothetical protein
MFISLVLNTEYGNILSRKLFYLQNLKFCAKNHGIMISYEYMKTHFEELRKGSSEQLLKSWDIDDIDSIGIEKVEQYFFPDSLFESVEKLYQSRTDAIFNMFENDIPELRECLDGFIADIKKKHPEERIEGLFCVQEPLGFVREVCKKNEITIIPYFFSALRQPHGYRETLYYVNLNDWLYSTNEPKDRYEKFLKESKLQFVLSHKELIALLGKIRTFSLLPYIGIEPKYELGVCCEAWSVIPQYFSRGKVTDDDIFFDADKYFTKDQLKVRSHALQLDEIQVDRSYVHNDPASYILSCRRLAAVRSQILLKALLWGRTTVAYTDMLGFSYLCEKSIKSTEKVDINALNWYLFGYLVPHDLMFSHDYWRWRLTNPSEEEIYLYNLNHLLGLFGLTIDALKDSRNDRFRTILENRIDDKELIDILCSENDVVNDNIDFDNAISKFEINKKSLWRINKKNNESLCCHCEVSVNSIESLYFYPFDDVAGIGEIDSIIINGISANLSLAPIYFEKVKGRIDLLPYVQKIIGNTPMNSIEVIWRTNPVVYYLNHFEQH